ncbi:ribonuclease domain-containing protein [Candidatus Amarobacter glycogenicus]|uniref:ribonuclease domain-containing protein n=1 Tax=Candidatus Amarobacter glycogenicus TaxID=3140699 RepID=UPI0031CC5F1B
MSDSHADAQKADASATSHSHVAAPAVELPGMEVPLLSGSLQRTVARLAGTTASSRGLTPASLRGLQRFAGNSAVARLVPLVSEPVTTAISAETVQRAVYKEGGKNAVAIPAEARGVAGWVTKPSVQAGGRNHIPDIQGRGFPGFKKGKDEYAGGRVFNNDAMPDGARLPHVAGQTYQEWDTIPCLAGQGRGADRIVTSSDGTAYYTNDHYKNFTELK